MAKHPPTVANRVIEKCGGHQAVADWLGVHISRVYRFSYPISAGGTGGMIPAKHQATLMQKAREAGIELKPDDFFEMPDAAAEPAGAAA